jgi:hypothetical protein
MLHRTRPEVAFSMSWQSGTTICVMIGCCGGTHMLVFSVTWADAGAAANAAARHATA